MSLYRITTENAVCGIETNRRNPADGKGRMIVVKAAPIFRWMILKDISYVLQWCRAKDYTVELIGETSSSGLRDSLQVSEDG